MGVTIADTPVVAAVNGFALGGGREIALCMDSEDARDLLKKERLHLKESLCEKTLRKEEVLE